MKISMTKKKWIALAAAVVALILLLVFVPFPLRINRTYHGYIHPASALQDEVGKDVTIQATGWRLCYLFFPEKWNNLSFSITANDGSPLEFSFLSCPVTYPEKRALIRLEDETIVETENELYWTRVGLEDYYAPNEGISFTLLYPPGYREFVLYAPGFFHLAITGSTDPDRAPADVLEQFRVKLEEARIFI